MKQKQDTNLTKKIIISALLTLIAIIIVVCLSIYVNAENTEGTAEQREDEKIFVKTIASTVRLNDANNIIDADTLASEFDRYVGTGKTTVTEKSSDTLLVTFLETGNEYEVNINTGPIFDSDTGSTELPSTTETTPYLPTGFSHVGGTDLSTGLTIQDGSGNQYVWVEVPRNTTVYDEAGLNLDLDNLTGTELTNAYTAIEDDLHDYTSVYRNGTSYSDVHSGNDASTGLTSTQYTELKRKMLKSVYENGGFYVGKYETGTATARESNNDTLTTAVIQANAYPYNYVTNSQAQGLASGMASGKYTSSLMFGVQWDLVLKYLETKGVSQSALNSDSSSWGNYSNNSWNITNASAKYWVDSTDGWKEGLSGSKPSRIALLSTGADSSFSKMGIYDLAGNVREWTLEYSSRSSSPCAVRGGIYNGYGSGSPARRRGYYGMTDAYRGNGFRVSLY